jgi:hypothetical protein
VDEPVDERRRGDVARVGSGLLVAPAVDGAPADAEHEANLGLGKLDLLV